MAFTGVVLVLFVMGHMLGNLLIFVGPNTLNAYAYKLHSIPDSIMTLIRLSLLLAVVVHIWMAVLLTIANKKAKPRFYKTKVRSTYASRTMRMSGVILLSFIIFHILHYTVRIVPTMEYNNKIVFSKISGISNYVPLYKGDRPVIEYDELVHTFNVYDMLIHGFKNPYVSFFYVLSVGLLCLHLAHGISSIFQTFGLRNSIWKVWLSRFAWTYGLIIFIGFASIPLAIQLNVLKYSWQNTDEGSKISKLIDLER